MAAGPVIRLADGRLTFGDAGSVLAVDPPATLAADLVDAWTEAMPAVANPRPRDLTADEGRILPESGDAPGGDGPVDVPRLELLGRKSVLDDVLGEFHAASRAAALLDVDRLEVRVGDAGAASPLVVSDDAASAIVEGSSGSAGERYAVTERDSSAAETLRDEWGDAMATADDYPIRTPSRAAVFAAFADRFDAEFAGEVLTLLDASDEIRRGDPCDHLVRPYLVGARHGVHHYDLRRAGEEAGLASSTTFSTVKSELVEDGLLATERVPRTVGRARQRIVLADDGLRDAPLSAYPEIVAERR